MTSPNESFFNEVMADLSIPAIHLLRLIFLESEKIGHEKTKIVLNIDDYEQETSGIEHQDKPNDYQATMVGIALLLIDNMAFEKIIDPATQTPITLLESYLATPFDYYIVIHPAILSKLKTIASVDKLFRDIVDADATDSVIGQLLTLSINERKLIMAGVQVIRMYIRNGQNYDTPVDFDAASLGVIFGLSDQKEILDCAHQTVNDLSKKQAQITVLGQSKTCNWLDGFHFENGVLLININKEILLPLLVANREQNRVINNHWDG